MKIYKTILLIIIILSNYSVCLSEGGWYQQQSNTNVDLNKIYFLNQDTGWVVGNSGKILKTTNGGIEWISQQSNLISPLRSVKFLNKNTGYAVGGKFEDFDFCHIDIIKTTNGGENWAISFSQVDFDNSASDVTFINAFTGFVTCFGGNESESVGLLYKTTNSGVNWVRSEYNTSFISINFKDENTGFIISNYYHDVLGDSLIIKKSNNNGNIWNSVFSMSNARLTSSIFLNSYTGWVAGIKYASGFGEDLILKTTNGGINWDNMNITTHSNHTAHSNIKSIYFSSYDTGWYCNSGIFKSINSGANWVNQVPVNGSDNFYSIFFVDNNTGWTVGTNGKIFKTVSGGLTTVNLSDENIPKEFSLSQNYPNPFNPKTVIRYSIQSNVKGLTSNVKLVIYNSIGIEISTLVNENQNAGSYSIDFNGENLSSGIYFYKLSATGEAGNYSEVRKMTLLK